MKTYVITLSQVFPATHPRYGEPTGFEHKVIAAVSGWGDHWLKIHTIRANYELWHKCFESIERGEACLSIRQWTGKPYASKQREIARLTKGDGIGLQRLFFHPDRDGQHVWWNFNIDGRYDDVHKLAQNDGLSYEDWRAWFKDYDLSKPLAIIHFTKFRY